MPEGVDVTKCDIIGKDVKRVLHYEAAKLWVEVIERPKTPPQGGKERS